MQGGLGSYRGYSTAIGARASTCAGQVYSATQLTVEINVNSIIVRGHVLSEGRYSCTSHRSVTGCSWPSIGHDHPPGKCSPPCWSSSVQYSASTPNLDKYTVLWIDSIDFLLKYQLSSNYGRLFYSNQMSVRDMKYYCLFRDDLAKNLVAWEQ